MNLDDFEDAIEQGIILTRGLLYYDDGSVLSLEETSPHTYSAKVAGSEVYEVTVTLDDDWEVEDISCTCPYDWSEHCKHEVAVLYALRDLLDGPDEAEELIGQQAKDSNGMGKKEKAGMVDPEAGNENKNKNEKEKEIDKEKEKEGTMVERPGSVDLRTLLQDVSKEELLAFLVDYGGRNPSLEAELVHAFPSPDDDVNLTNLGIEFRRACLHGGEITYYGRDYEWEAENEENYIWNFTSTFKEKIEELLQMIRVAIREGRNRYAGSIASMMVHEITAFDCDVDHIGEDVERALAQIASLFAELVPSPEDGRWLFEQFFAEVDNYDNKAQATLLRLCIHFADAQEDQEGLETYLIDLASDETEGEWGFNTILKNSIELRHALLLKQQRVAEAQAFALGNLQYDSLRKLAYDRAMETEEYELAQKLAYEVLAIGQGGPGRRLSAGFNWGELLFRVYQESGNTEDMRGLAKSFLLGGNLEYYHILKESYDEEAWKSVVDGLLDELEARDTSNKGYRTSVYPEVLKAENKLQRLLSYVQNNPFDVRSYQDVLLPHYQQEVFALYRNVILLDGESSSSRSEYKGLASWLKELVSIGGTSVAKDCLQVLEPRYKKRPAMKDELRKAGLL